MQIAETYALAEWINDEIVDAQVVQEYDALFNVVDQNASRPQNQAMQPFEDQRVALFETISSVNLNALSLSQLESLETLGIKPYVGKAGTTNLAELLSNTLDIALVAKRISEFRSELTSGIAKAAAIKQALEPLVDINELDVDSNSILTRVIFEHDASIDDIAMLKSWSSKLFDIGRGFAIAQGQTPQDIRVIGASKGSLIFELAIFATKVVPIATAVGLILTAMVKFKEYQLKAIEVRRMKAEDADLAEELEEDAVRWDQRADKLKAAIAVKVAEEVRQSIVDFKEENTAEYEKAVRTLVDLYAKGGSVDCVIPEEEEDEEREADTTAAFETLRQTFARIRDLRETPLLEHLKVDDEEEIDDEEGDDGV